MSTYRFGIVGSVRYSGIRVALERCVGCANPYKKITWANATQIYNISRPLVPRTREIPKKSAREGLRIGGSFPLIITYLYGQSGFYSAVAMKL